MRKGHRLAGLAALSLIGAANAAPRRIIVSPTSGTLTNVTFCQGEENVVNYDLKMAAAADARGDTQTAISGDRKRRTKRTTRSITAASSADRPRGSARLGGRAPGRFKWPAGQVRTRLAAEVVMPRHQRRAPSPSAPDAELPGVRGVKGLCEASLDAMVSVSPGCRHDAEP